MTGWQLCSSLPRLRYFLQNTFFWGQNTVFSLSEYCFWFFEGWHLWVGRERELVFCLTRVGWKVHRLTKKELCHCNETWHALNSTFSDTNCIVSFQTNPHWISNLGLWKVVLETFQKQPGKLMKGVLFHQDNAHAHKSVAAMAAVHDCGFELVDHPFLIWHHLTLFCPPTWKNPLGWEAVSDQ